MFWCLDDAKGSSASKFYSRQESKNPRKSRYMIKLISRILGRSFQIEKAKGLAKDFYLNQFKLRFTLCNQLPAAENVYNSH